MALRIFETDPEAKPTPRVTFDDGTIGKLHSGKVVGTRPVALEAWRFSTGEHNVASALAELFASQVEDTGSDKENYLAIDTEAESVAVILAGPSALSSDMKQWINGKLVHHCDGVDFLSPAEDAGRPCGCPQFFKDRKEAAKNYRGPSPSIKVIFRLADDPELGTFAFQTGSWTLAEVLWQYEDALSQIDGEIAADLRLELVEYTTKQGRAVRYRKPVLENIRSYNDAIAE
jgi:hypothetical protein